MIEKVGENLYRSHLRPFKQRPYRLGYAAQGTDYQFSKEVSTGLQRAAAAQGIELISVDNRYNAEDRPAQRRRPGAREGRPGDRVPDRRARRADRRGQVPRRQHPADRDRGAAPRRHLLRREQLRGRPDRRAASRPLGQAACARRASTRSCCIALDRAGSLPKMRLTGMLVGMKEVYPQLEHCRVTYLDGDGKLGESFEAMRRHLRSSQGARLPDRRDQRSERARRAARDAGSRTRRRAARSWARTRRRKAARSCASPARA